MKINNLFYIFFIGLMISCNNDQTVDINKESFVYVETLNFDDYSGESSLKYEKSENFIHKQNGFIKYQILNSKIIYLNEDEFIEFNPRTKQYSSIISLTSNLIHSFSFSPDRKILAYSNYKDIILLNIENGTQENLTSNLIGDFRFPKWSPDGNSILIRNNIPITRPGDPYPTATGNFKIFSMSNNDFKDVKMYDTFASPGNVEWSPNNNEIVYEQYQKILLFDLNSEKLTILTPDNVIATDPKFSTDGNKISYFSSDSTHNGNNWQNFLTLYEINNQNHTVLNDIYSYDASWNIDSNEIIFSTNTGIYLFNLTNNTNTKLIESNKSKFLYNSKFIK